MESEAKDLNVKPEFQTVGFTQKWKCISKSTNEPCQKRDGTELKETEMGYESKFTLPRKIFTPY